VEIAEWIRFDHVGSVLVASFLSIVSSTIISTVFSASCSVRVVPVGPLE
jgi:hypothetical protein